MPFTNPVWDELYCIWVKFLYRHWNLCQPLPPLIHLSLPTMQLIDRITPVEKNSQVQEVCTMKKTMSETHHSPENNNVMNNTSLGMLNSCPRQSWGDTQQVPEAMTWAKFSERRLKNNQLNSWHQLHNVGLNKMNNFRIKTCHYWKRKIISILNNQSYA